MKKLNKKNLLVSAASVATAATLLFGGATYAYLQDETEDKVNTFNANKVLVDLVETDGEGNPVSGLEYDIIPGTEAKKDPTVTVDASTAAYVFVKVTDTTGGLATYTIEDGWTEIEELRKATETATEKVYYRTVEGSAEKQTFPVLAENKVTFDKSIVNSQMIQDDGKTLKEGLTLTFKATAVQREPFTDALQAYKLGTAETVKEAADIQTALDQGGTVAAENDINVVYTGTSNRENAATLKDNNTLYLDGHTVNIQTESGQNGIVTEKGSVASIENGTIIQDKAYGSSYPVIMVNQSTLTLDNVTVKLTNKNAVCVSAGSDGGNLIIKNSTIEGSDSKYNSAVFVGSQSQATLENCKVIGCIRTMTNAKVYINSGDYTAANFSSGGSCNIYISGGTFAVNPKTDIQYARITEGHQVVENADGTYSVVSNA